MNEPNKEKCECGREKCPDVTKGICKVNKGYGCSTATGNYCHGSCKPVEVKKKFASVKEIKKLIIKKFQENENHMSFDNMEVLGRIDYLLAAQRAEIEQVFAEHDCIPDTACPCTDLLKRIRDLV